MKYTEVFSMLVLSRKESQRIRLGDSIVVTIVKISADKVRVGIDAPSDILVLRDELEPLAPLPQSATESIAALAVDSPIPLPHSA
jgi:carbon storage regulator